MNQLDKIFAGLTISEEIRHLFTGGFDETALLSTAKILALNPFELHSSEIAGRLYMYAKLRFCSRTVETYVAALSHRLRHEFTAFLLRHREKIDELMAELDYLNYDLNYLSANKLCGSYLLSQSFDRDPVETPLFLYLRVATELYYREGIDSVLRKFKEMAHRLYTHASPTLYNAGTPRPQCSSCFLETIYDDLASIAYDGMGNSAIISKNMGGLGINMNNLRSGQVGYSGMAGGPLAFARGLDRFIGMADQGGRRSGNATFFVRDWNLATPGMIAACDSAAPAHIRFENAVTCVWVSNLFMKRCVDDEEWFLFSPDQVDDLCDLYLDEFEERYKYYERLAVEREQEYEELKRKHQDLRLKVAEDPRYALEFHHAGVAEVEFQRHQLLTYKKIRARELMDKICSTQMKRSIYVMYCDKINGCCNMSNIGVVNCSNLCLEITEPSTNGEVASCNLASLNLKAFCLGERPWDGEFSDIRKYYDFSSLGETTQSVVENLNRVIDINYYPLDEVSEQGIKRGPISIPNFNNRPVGLGVSGLGDVFLNMDLPYDSPEAAQLNKMIHACMYFNACISSVREAIKEGEYKNFRTGKCKIYDTVEEKWLEVGGSPMSNGLLQFDLWKNYTAYMRKKGYLVESYVDESSTDFGLWGGEKLYNVEDDEPLDPSEWGQSKVVIDTFNYKGERVVVEIEPSWAALKSAIMKYGMRNSMLLALMPTASTADSLGNTESTETHQQLVYYKDIREGKFMVVVPQLKKDLHSLGLLNETTLLSIMACGGSFDVIPEIVRNEPHLFPDFDPKNMDKLDFLKEKYQNMLEISQKVVMQHARQRGIYIDQSQSMNLYMGGEPTMERLRMMMKYGWASLLKTGIYYLRQAPDMKKAKNGIPLRILKLVEKYQDLKADESEEELESEEEFVCQRGENCEMCSA